MDKSLHYLLHEALGTETLHVSLDKAQISSALGKEANRSLSAAMRLYFLIMGALWAPPILLRLWRHPPAISGGGLGDSLLFRFSPIAIAFLSAFLLPIIWKRRGFQKYSVQKRFQLAAFYRTLTWVGFISALGLSWGCWLARTGGDKPMDMLMGVAGILTGCMVISVAHATRKTSGFPLPDKRILASMALGGLAGLSVPPFLLPHRPPMWVLLPYLLLGVFMIPALGWLSWRSIGILARRLDPYWFE